MPEPYAGGKLGIESVDLRFQRRYPIGVGSVESQFLFATQHTGSKG